MRVNSREEKLHTFKWSTITLPKHLGGLGILEMRTRNEAILTKLCWSLANEQEAPWAKMLMTKYFTDARISYKWTKLSCSKIWAAYKKSGYILNSGLKWVIWNGASTNLWYEFWLPLWKGFRPEKNTVYMWLILEIRGVTSFIIFLPLLYLMMCVKQFKLFPFPWN